MSSDQKNLNRIHHYQSYHEQLSKLNRAWDAISTMGAINQDLLRGQGQPLLDSMRETRHEFTRLQERLFHSLMDESVAKITSELTFFAQNTIDILIRNLYERTADVGFLATDTVVSSFLAPAATVAPAVLRTRLQEYVRKYSVYDEIVLLDTRGQVRARLQEDNPATCDNALLPRLRAGGAFLEYLGPTTLTPARSTAHIFARAVHDLQHSDEPLLGYLLLFFRLEDELERIFAGMRHNQPDLVLLVLDGERRVLTSSHPLVAAPGDVLAARDGTIDRPLQLHSRDYFSITRASSGYQGYQGLPGLRVMALLPAAVALNQRQRRRVAPGTAQTSAAMSPALRAINRDSASINRKLRIITVNGKCLAARLEARTFVPILENIQDVGSEITRVVTESITELNQTALSAILSNCQLYSALAVDLMDRNLYERANDCRWWALTPAFIGAISALQQGALTAAECQRQLTRILRYINGLYTVYTNLLIYDAQGQILACSANADADLVGTRLPDTDSLQRCILLRDSQSYVVSAFAPTPLYARRPTYTYHAAIRHPTGRVLAGVGVVFDAEPEFRAMLEAALPRDRHGAVREGAGGLYLDRQGRVLSSTDARFAVGSKLALPAALEQLDSGQSWAGAAQLGGVPVLLGATASRGYREYKTTGDYQNDVFGVIFVDAGA